MTEAPERIWATVNGLRTGMPGAHSWLIGGWEARAKQSERETEYVRKDLFDAVKAERDTLEARVEVLTQALEFYADESTYVTHYAREACDRCTRSFEPINEDRGETALRALQENTDDR